MSVDDSFAMLPLYIASAMGVNRDWVLDARCRPAGPAGRDDRGPWVIASNETIHVGGSRYDGKTLIAYALLVCANCPAQWDCTTFAVQTMPNWGTWGCDITDLRWLANRRRKERATEVLEAARFSGTPVQVAIRRERATSPEPVGAF